MESNSEKEFKSDVAVKSNQIIMVDPTVLVPNPKNNNRHPKEQYDRLKKIIKHSGFRVPITVSNRTGFIVCGHLRCEVAILLGMEKVPVIYQDFENEADEYAHLTAENEIARWAELDYQAVYEELKVLDIDDIDMLGIEDFKLPEIDLDEGGGFTDEDDVPEIENEPVTKRGDVWLLGDHRVMCGDSTSESEVEKLMNGKKADMVFTSPPYNGDTHLDYGKGNNKKLYENNTDKWTSSEYIEFCTKALDNLFLVTEGFIFWNVNYNAKSRYEYIKVINPYIERLWETIIWKKTGMPIASGLTRNCEFIFCFKNGERKHLSEEFKTEFNLWDISNIGAQDKKNHRACFPVELPEKGINIGSKPNELILEPFLGSGSTLIACEKVNRKCYGMELDEHYCDVIVKRWEDFTGKKAILESTGETFERTLEERL